MDGFHSFNTGNRKKFLQQAKKRKQQTFSTNTSLVAQKQLMMVQASIRRFLNSKRIQAQQSSPLQLLKLPIEAFGQVKILQRLKHFQQSNIFLFNFIHRMSIVYMEGISQSRIEMSQSKFILSYLGRYCTKIRLIFDRLNKRQKIFWVKRILTRSVGFTFNLLNKNQQQLVHKIITLNNQTFIEIIGQIKNDLKLIEQIIKFVCSYPCHTQIPQVSIQKQRQEKIRRLPLEKIYQNINLVLRQKQVKQIGQYPIFLLQSIDLIIKIACIENRLSVMKTYNIDPIYIKSQGQFIDQIIKEKEQWQNFMDFLNITNKFNISVVHWFINLNNYQQALKSSSYIATILELIPLQFPLHMSSQDLMMCLNKITQWIRVHEISSNEQQQLLLLPFCLILNRKIFRLTDKQFMIIIKKYGQVFQKILRDKLIIMIYKVILISKNTLMIQKVVKICVELLEEIYKKIFRTNTLNTQIFVSEVLSKKLIMYSQAKADNEIVQFLKKFPFIFSLKDRARKFRQAVKNFEQYNYYDYDYQMYVNGKVKIRRGFQFEDAFNQLKNKNIKKGFKITFIDQFGSQERGVDAGGLTKQFINRVLKAAFRPEFGMFVQNSDKELLADPKKLEYQTGIFAQYYQFIGKMIGKALYQGFTIGPKFCGPFLNTIIGKKNNFDDLRKIDKQLYNSLTYIKTMEQDASQLCLTFLYRDQVLKKNVNLKNNGHRIKVTNENKQQYVSLLANYKVNKSLEFQSRHIRRGLKQIINSQWLFMFNYEQLNYLISGSGEIKIHELKAITRYHGYNQKDQTIRLFWQVVSEFDQQNKSNLLMFVTGCPRPSFLGFEDMSPPFTIIQKQDITCLPISHTCSNVLELPNYKNKQILAQKLKKAINQCSGFQLA